MGLKRRCCAGCLTPIATGVWYVLPWRVIFTILMYGDVAVQSEADETIIYENGYAGGPRL